MVGQSLHYGDRWIPYQVVFSTERRGKLSIHVLPTGVVRVEAPQGTALAEIKQAVARRARWVNAHLGRVDAQRMHILPREYVSGESHFYLGRRYLLKIHQSDQDEPYVALHQGRFRIITPDRDPDLVGSMLSAWYRQRARVIFAGRLGVVCERLPWLKEVPHWKLLAMKRQWGSCSPAGVLSLNPHLIKASPICIDYVLLHELCHLRLHNHSKGFYRLLDRNMPGWQAVKSRLDGMSEQLLGPCFTRERV